MLEVIGAGFGRTGTHSLAEALVKLGFGPCYHMLELHWHPEHTSTWMAALDGAQIDWRAFFEPYRSTVEWPAVSFLPHILPFFPQAKVILTLRDSDEWFESANASIFDGLEMSAYNPDPRYRERGSLSRRLILEGVFSGRQREREHAIAVYEQHIADVIEIVPAERLLRYHVREGWRPLCEFLGVGVPSESFPYRNKRAEFVSTEPEWAKEIRSSRSENGDSNSP